MPAGGFMKKSTVAIVDYGSGNLRSAEKALARAASEHATGHEIVVTSDPDVVAMAERVVLPGVGAFADCMRGLSEIPGMIDVLNRTVIVDGKPFLGICVGMQLMASRGLEHEIVAGLNWIPGDVDLIRPNDKTLKIPHMGWNTLECRRDHPVLAGVATGERGLHAYFVHSFQLYASNPDDVVATADYGGPITAIVARDNIVGTQFHPEKSQTLGLALIGNFLKWRP
jgi:imidazole glycerol-phosphate synthase subunit HisH